MPKPPQNLRDFQSLVDVMTSLRGPEGCPWDKEQTHQSLTRFAIEEAHELAEACDKGDPSEIKDELGDVLLQVVLHAEIARQEGHFDISDVIETLNQKMVRRHPHVFSDTEVSCSKEVMSNWDAIKEKEKGVKQKRFISLPSGLPSLIGALKIGQKARKIDFDWENLDQVFEKVEEEISELKEAIAQYGKDEQSHELGDLLFCIAQVARHLEVDPETALRVCNTRFLSRVDLMMQTCEEQNLNWSDLSADQKEKLWTKAKNKQTKF